jgi:hypothetical protein
MTSQLTEPCGITHIVLVALSIGQLKLIAEDIAHQEHLEGHYFQGVSDSLGKLLAVSPGRILQLVPKFLFAMLMFVIDGHLTEDHCPVYPI